MNKKIKIRNLDCAACAAELSEQLEGIEGITKAHADFINQQVFLEYEGAEAWEKAIDTISHFEEVEIIDGNAPQKRESRLKEILSIAVSAAFFVPALVCELCHVNEWVVFGLFFASFAAAGWSVLLKVFKFRGWKNFLDENLLMSLAAIAAFAIREPMEGAAVMLLYQIGELLQSIAVGSSRGAIARLVQMKCDVAIRIKDGEQEEIDPEELTAGDTVLLRKGDKIPADCTLLSGETALDVKSLTGESVPREVRTGDELLAGSVNLGNAVTARVLRPVSESAVSRILEMVENSSERKAKAETFITKFARVYTPVVAFLAVLLAIVPPLFDGFDFMKWMVPALEFLVISCPCALIISVPLTYFSGVGALARCGVLAKGAVYLDSLAKVDIAAFDKTGTLTEGKFRIVRVNGGERALLLAASLEQDSSHPLSQAFVGERALPVQAMEEVAGMGLRGIVEGRHVLVGSERFLQEEGVTFEPVESTEAVVYVAEEHVLVGSVEIGDTVRADAEEALASLKRSGIRKTAVLTGDSPKRAEQVRGIVDDIYAGLLPEGKLARAEELAKEGTLLYVGDGINDTPVMAAADVSVAMGGLGSDAAIEASDFVLAGDSLSALPKAYRGAKKTRKIVRENIVFSIAVKVVLMALSVVAAATAAFSLPIWAAVAGDVGVMLLAVCNSLRMRTKLK